MENATTAPPPLSSSWAATPSQRLETSCRAALSAIHQTQQGQSKSWLNVQPCVLDTTAALIQLNVEQARRLDSAEQTIEQMRQVLEVLVKDRQTKETRYQMDLKAHEDAHHLLGRAVQDVQVMFETERQAHNDFHESVVLTTLRGLQDRLRTLEAHAQLKSNDRQGGRRGKVSPRHTRRGHARHARAASSSSSSSSAASASRSSSSSSSVAPTPSRQRGQTRRLIAEVQLLREQWKQFVALQTATLTSGPTASPQQQQGRAHSRKVNHVAQTNASDAEDDEYDDDDEVNDRSGWTVNPRRAPRSDRTCACPHAVAPQRARWCWFGESGTHFPAAMRTRTSPRRSPFASSSPRLAPEQASGASPAIAWTDQRLYDVRTDCWYSTGACRYATSAPNNNNNNSNNGEIETSAGLQWACFTWVRPSVIRIERTGIYKVVACLVRDCATSSSAGGGGNGASRRESRPALVIEVDDGLYGVVHHLDARRDTTTLYFSEPGRRGSSARRGSPARAPEHIYADPAAPWVPSPFNASSQRRVSPPSRQPSRVSTRSPVRFHRECCGPAQTHTHTLYDHLFLSAGALVRVRCRNVHDTKAVYEAFMELEYMA